MNPATRIGVTALIASLSLGSLPLIESVSAASSSPSGKYQPARGGNFLAWEQVWTETPNRYEVRAKRVGARGSFRVNAPGTDAANGGIDGSRLVYQQWKGGESDIFEFDLRTGKRKRMGVVSSGRWEYWPSISGDWLLYGRRTNSGLREILLQDVTGGQPKLLDYKTTPNAFELAPGQVSGDFAVWNRCGRERCDVFRYKISTGKTTKVPNKRGVRHQAPSVTPEGTVYFIASGNRCGADVSVKRWNGEHLTAISALPDGRDSSDTYAYAGPEGRRQVLYESYECGKVAGSYIRKTSQRSVARLTVSPSGTGAGTITVSPGELDCQDTCSSWFFKGMQVTLTASPGDGSTFIGWTGACADETSTSCTFAIEEDEEISATFEGVQHLLSVTKEGTGAGRITAEGVTLCESDDSDCSREYDPGSVVTLTAVADVGSRFTGWTGDCVPAGVDCEVTMDAAKTLVARFELDQP